MITYFPNGISLRLMLGWAYIIENTRPDSRFVVTRGGTVCRVTDVGSNHARVSSQYDVNKRRWRPVRQNIYRVNAAIDSEDDAIRIAEVTHGLDSTSIEYRTAMMLACDKTFFEN